VLLASFVTLIYKLIEVTLFFVFCFCQLKKGVTRNFLFLGVWVTLFSLSFFLGAAIEHPSPIREVQGSSPSGTMTFELICILLGADDSYILHNYENKLKFSVCKHSEHQAIKVLQSLRVTNLWKHTETSMHQGL
jgi:hypothetical protein